MCEIGKCIRDARISAGISRDEAVDRLASLGVDLSSSMLGALERGERRVAAQTMLAMAQAYRCSIEKLYGIPERSSVHEGMLSDHERAVAIYMFESWPGDYHALIDYIGMYMAADVPTRAQIAGTSLRIFRDARNDGMHISVPYEVRTPFIARKWGELLDKE